MLDLTYCPEPGCDSPAEIVDRYALASTDGPIEHVAVRCLHRHWFFMPADRLATPHPVVDRRDVFRIG
jgi:hypothetical protein